MTEKIYTIPINEAFDNKGGCPLCALAAQLEESSLEYIMGAAMMEPDVRMETNKQGFCREHYNRMLAMKNRLSLALMLESRLGALETVLTAPDIKTGMLSRLKKNEADLSGQEITQNAESCYVCSRAAGFEKQYLSNVVYMYKKDEAFRSKLIAQDYFCLGHYGKLLQTAKAELSEALYSRFASDLYELERAYLTKLSQSVTAFCRSFDHQNAGKPLTADQTNAVQDAANFLAGI